MIEIKTRHFKLEAGESEQDMINQFIAKLPGYIPGSVRSYKMNLSADFEDKLI